MSTPPFPEWCDAAPDAAFSAPHDCSKRASKFERTIRIRNTAEYAAAVLVLILFGGSAIGALAKGEGLMAIAFALIIIGTGFVIWRLYKNGSNLKRRPEDPCIMHLKSQYRRQYELLRSVPRWYLAPFLPGLVMLYGVIAIRTAERVGWVEAFLGLAGPVAMTVGVFGLVALLNWWGAKGLKRKIDDLSGLA